MERTIIYTLLLKMINFKTTYEFTMQPVTLIAGPTVLVVDTPTVSSDNTQQYSQCI